MKKQLSLLIALCAFVFVGYGQNAPTLYLSSNPVINIGSNSCVIVGTAGNPNPGDTLLVWASVIGGPYISDTVEYITTGPISVSIPVFGMSSALPYSSIQLHGIMKQSGLSGSSAVSNVSFTTLSSPTNPQITFPNSAVVTPYSVKVRFHYNFGCTTLTQVKLNWGMTSSLGTYLPQSLFLTGAGDTAFTISGLSPGNTVQYRTETTSNCAVSASANQTATTIAVPAPYSTCPTAVNVTYQSADIPFTVMPGSSYAGSTVTKVVLIETVGNTVRKDSLIGSWNTLLVDTFHRTGLPGNTSVSYVLQYYNQSGAMDYCTRSFMTAPYPAPPQVVVGQATGISSCNAHVPVTITAPNGGTVYVEHRPVNQNIFVDSVLVCTNCTTGVYVVEVAPFLEESTYYIRSREWTHPQNVGYGNQISVTTLQGESPAVEILGDIDLNPAGIFIHYNAAGNGFATTLKAIVRDSSGVIVAQPLVHIGSCFVTNGSIGPIVLPLCRNYDVDLEAESDGGVHSDTESFRSGCAGIDEASALSVTVYPNPTSEMLFVGEGDFIADQLIVIDMSGRVVMTRTNTRELSVSYLASGMYTLHIKADGKESMQKFMKN